MKYLLIFLMVPFYMGGCQEYELEGHTVAKIYPQHNLARVRTITQSCPLRVSSATHVAISDLPAGGCWVPQEQCDKYFNDYESKVCK